MSQEDPLERKMATHASILPWEILWIEEPGRLQSMGVTRVGHDLATEGRERDCMLRNSKLSGKKEI